MSFALNLAIRGQLQPFLDADKLAYKKAVTSVVRRKTRQVEKGFKRHIERADFVPGGGRRLSKDISSRVFPRRGASSGAAGLIFSKTSVAVKKRRPGRGVDVIAIFEQDTTVRPRRSNWLAIPTAEGKALGGAPGNAPRELSPRTFRGGPLQFIPGRRPNYARLVLKRDTSVTVFILVRQVHLRRRLSLEPIYVRASRNVADLIVRSWERELDKAVRRLRR